MMLIFFYADLQRNYSLIVFGIDNLKVFISQWRSFVKEEFVKSYLLSSLF